MARTLSHFTVTPDGNGEYLITLEDEYGETSKFTADDEQLDAISEAIEEALEAIDEDGIDEPDDADADPDDD